MIKPQLRKLLSLSLEQLPALSEAHLRDFWCKPFLTEIANICMPQHTLSLNWRFDPC